MLQPKPRLITFRFSVTQSYALEFGEQYFRIISNGGYVVEAGKTITGATQANPCQITATAHGYSNGDWVFLSGIGGMTQLNGNTYIVAGAAANTFTLQDLDGNAIDSTGYGAYTSGGTAARIYTVVTPYAAADLPALKFTQSADVMSLTHPNYPPQDLKRLAATNWTISPTSFGSSIGAPVSGSAVATVIANPAATPPTLPTAYSYVITAVDAATGQESVASGRVDVTNSVDIAAVSGAIQITWAAVAGADHYNLYKAPPAYNTNPPNNTALPVPAGAIYGFVGASYGTQFVDTNITASTTLAPPKHQNPFAPGQITGYSGVTAGTGYTSDPSISVTTATGSGFVGQAVIVSGALVAIIIVSPGQNYLPGDTFSFSGGGGTGAAATPVIGPQTGTYPSLVAYFQQRRVYAASLNKPDTYFMSEPGAFTDFDTSLPVSDADAITGTPWSEQVDGIVWMVSMPLGLVTFTGNGIWQVGAGGGFASSPSAITPANEIAAPQSSIGSSATVPPIRINWNILYVQAKGSAIRDLTYQLYFNIYTGLDISWPSSHLLIGHHIREWAWCEEPFRVLWMVRDDGILLSLTYLKEQEVVGWARHDTRGQVVSVCSVSEPPVDALYMVVERLVPAGGARYFVERMDNRLWAGVEDSWCVDCAVGSVLTTTAFAIAANAASGAGVTFLTTGNVFAPGNVGNVIRMGGGIAVITGYTSATNVTGTWLYPCQQIIPNDPLGTPVPQNGGAWTLAGATTTFGGLNHLIGQQVVGIADGVPVGPFTVSASGTVTLPFAASNVKIGLGFTAQLQSLYLDTGMPTIQGRRKAISAVTARVEASCKLQAGANQNDAAAQSPVPLFQNWNGLAAVPDQGVAYTNSGGATVTSLYTGDLRVLIPSDWRKPGQVAIQQVNPLPLNLLALIPEILPGDTPEVELSQRQQGGDARAGRQRRAA